MTHLKILTLCALVAIFLLTACKKDLFEEEIFLCPKVELTDPEDQATGVPTAQIISVVFNTELDPATVNTTSIIVDGVAGNVSYSGVTATFTPNNQLDLNSTFIGRVTTSVKDLQGNAMPEEYVWTFTTSSTLSPLVVNVDPSDASNGAVLNKTIIATFNMAMEAASINANTFTLSQSGTQIDGTITHIGLQAFFKPEEDLSANTEYTAAITTGARNTFGQGMVNDYEWTFTTGATLAPNVLNTNPAHNEEGVPINKTITATFSVPMNSTTLDGASFLLTTGGSPVNGEVSYSNSVVSFSPTTFLQPNTIYTATILDDAISSGGTAMANDHIWTFTTGVLVAPSVTSTNPGNNATNVSVNQAITASFSESMNPATMNGSSFLIMDGTVEIEGVVSYNGLTATFTPDSDLDFNRVYSATINNSAENFAGEGLANDFTWRFTTQGNGFSPTVNLAGVERFGIISGTGVINSLGISQINNMDVGVSPGFRSSITGFSLVDGGTGIINNGNFYAGDDAAPVPSMLLQAKNDLGAAYLTAEGANVPAAITVSGDLGGRTLSPGIYKSNSTLSIQNGNLTLDGQGNPNAEWIFQVPSTLTTFGSAPFPSPAGGNVILTGGAQAKNVTWQVGSSATLGDYTSFNGNILALTSVTMNSFSQANGRMLSRNGSVTLTRTNTINKP